MLSRLQQLAQVLTVWGLPYAVVLAALFTVASQTQLGKSLNELLFDRLVDFESQLISIDSRVLIVYVDREDSRHADNYLKMVDRATELGASAIGIATVDLSSWNSNQLSELSENPRLVIGAVSDGERPATVHHGSVKLFHSLDGCYRFAWGRIGSKLDSFASALASVADPTIATPKGLFRVRFRGKPESLPHVHGQSLLNGELTAAMVKDRVVVFGDRPGLLESGIATPTTGTQRMSALEFHGQAINSLVTRRWIRDIPANGCQLLYLCSALIFLIWGRRARLDQGFLLLLIVLVVQTGISFAILWRLNYTTPIVSLWLIALTSVLISLVRRMRFSERAWQMMRRRGFSVSPRYRTQPYISPDDAPWQEIGKMFQHFFPVDGIALLVREGERDRLCLEATVGYSTEHVVERRRDIRRAPFQDAVEQRATIVMPEGRNFFKPTDGQMEFVVPLFHGGRIKGLAIVELSKAVFQQRPAILQQLTKVGDEVAPWIARFQQLKHEAIDGTKWWNRLGRLEESETFRRLRHHMRAFERRLHQSFAVIENSSSGRAVFSLGGDALTINASMFRILHSRGIPSPNASLLTTIHRLTQRPLPECREIIRRALVEGRLERIVAKGQQGDNSLIILVQPLANLNDITNAPEDMFAFEADGVQVEVFETKLFGEVHTLKEHVTEQALSTVDDVLADVVTSTVDSHARDADSDFQRIESEIERVRQTIKHCQNLLENTESEDIQVQLPVDLAGTVETAVTESGPYVEQHHASVTSSIATDLPNVSANPHRLRQALSIVIQVLVEHARDNSVIHISATERDDRVEITLENEGCGVALDRLSGLRYAQKERMDDRSRVLEVESWIEAWGGSLDIESDLGEGAIVHVVLRRFDWSVEPEPNDVTSDIKEGGR